MTDYVENTPPGFDLRRSTFLKKWLLILFCKAEIGHKAQIGWFSAVTGKHVVIADHATIRPLTLIQVSGDVRIGSHAEISSFILVYGSASFKVGNWSYIGPQSLINVDEDVVIGNESPWALAVWFLPTLLFFHITKDIG